MVELHSNFTVKGSSRSRTGSILPQHQWHETLEITHGFTDWFETVLVRVLERRAGQGWQWVGDHIPASHPEKWKWPVGLSLSTEIQGYQLFERRFLGRHLDLGNRPIIDRNSQVVLVVQPSFDRSFHGPSVQQRPRVLAELQGELRLHPKVSGGLEYYGALAPVTGFDPLRDQQQQINSSHRSEPVTQLGIQPGRRRRYDARYGSPAGENDSGIPVQT